MALYVFNDDERRSYHTEADTSSLRLRRRRGCVEILDPEFVGSETTKEWVKVTWKRHRGVHDTSENREAKRFLPDRWLRKAEFPSDQLLPQPTEISLRQLVRRTVNVVFEWQDKTQDVPSCEWILALAGIENAWDIDESSIDVDDMAPMHPDRSTGAALGIFGIVEDEWSAYIADVGADRVGPNPDLWRGNALSQIDCVFWLANRDWKAFENLYAGQDYAPSNLDLLLARMVGPDAAKMIGTLVATGTGMQKVKTILKSHPPSSNVRQRLSRYERFLGPNGGDARVSEAYEAIKSEFADALTLGFDLCREFAPEIMITHSTGEQPGYRKAVEQLQLWSANSNWTEHSGDGRREAAKYFLKANGTPWNPPPDLDQTGEITHWCGLFVAWCIDQWNAEQVGAGGTAKKIPDGPAASKSWRSWGDASISAGDDAGTGGIPLGAVVLLPREDKTIGHVGFFNGWEHDPPRADSRMKIIGGNQSDRVTENLRNRTEVVDIRVVVSPKASTASEDMDVFVRTLSGEVRGALSGNDDAPIENVAHVIMNRFLGNKRSRGTIRSVCKSPSQFSCWNEDAENRRNLDHITSLKSTDQEYIALLAIAERVLEQRIGGGDAPDRFGQHGKRVYHYIKNGSPKPNWFDPSKVVLEGSHHVFLRDIAL